MQQQRQQKLSEIGKKLNYIKSFSIQSQSGQQANVSSGSIPSIMNASRSNNTSKIGDASRTSSLSTSSFISNSSGSAVEACQPKLTEMNSSAKELDASQPGLHEQEKAESSLPSISQSSASSPSGPSQSVRCPEENPEKDTEASSRVTSSTSQSFEPQECVANAHPARAPSIHQKEASLPKKLTKKSKNAEKNKKPIPIDKHERARLNRLKQQKVTLSLA